MKRTLAYAATLLVSASISAAAAARPMTPEDVAKLEGVGAVSVSPDGSRIAYTTTRLPDVTEGADNGVTRHRLMVAHGPNAATAFLPDDISASGVAFSPDGRMVSFIWAKGDEKRAVWGVPVEGGTYRKLAAVKDVDVTFYTWGPDSATLYLLVGAEPDKNRDAEKKAGFDAVVYEEEYRLNRLYAARVGAEIDAAPRAIAVPGFVSAVDVTPDGRSAIVKTAPTPNVDDSYVATRVNVLDLATGRVRAVVETPGKLGDVEISPDGRQLSMIAAVDMNDPADTTLHLVDVASGSFRALNAGAAEAAIDAAWLDDGRLAAVIHVGAQSRLRIYNPDGSLAQEIDPGELILTEVHTGGGRLAVEANSPRHPGELFVWSGGAGSGAGAFERWTSHNPWLSEITFGNQRTVTYTARDGQQVEGVLIEPIGRAPRGGAPTIMNIHGGPEAHESNGWLTAYSKPGQVAAGKGYAVFLPNYRGSTGYGTAFSKQHQGDYAGKEFDDIVDAKRHLVAAGVTDANRVGITGGSYGGFATAWGSTFYSSEFAAGVMFIGISNNISKFGTTDIPLEMYNVHELKWPWEEWDELLQRSPIYHVDKAKTPLLIMHGENDTRVSPTQSYELHRHIKIRQPDTPVRLVLYPNEGHGSARAAARYDYNVRMMEWFDTYLKTGNRTAPLPAPRPKLERGKTDEAKD